MTPEEEERFTSLVAKGQAAFEEQSYGPALDALDEAYDLKQTPAINQMLTRVLLADGQYKTAQLFADEFIDSYLATNETAQLYVTVALHNQQFLAAREFIMWLPEAQRADLMAQVVTAEMTARQTQQATITTIARHFYHLSDGDAISQRERLIAADKLPLDEYLVGARFVLLDPFLTAISRVSVLDRLRRLRVTQSVDMVWLDGGTLTVVPAQLESIENMVRYQAIVTELQSYERTVGPAMVHGLAEQVRLMLMIAYPVLERVAIEPKSWVAGLIAESLGNTMPQEAAEQSEWRAKLQAEMLALMA
ncbi:hypothetical protein [Weissella cibaria]|uniref:Tetratricopeptide repeat protein n=1 Tax=Weissella cibaria TaxID=137591 RepID=A0A9Q8N930_9LACO|nr:hypothetical protein [Weissella cibaria]QDG80276.1 hypothetical protein Wei3612_02315 [Weissella cibaria]QMU87532.1 hypothetical protein H3N00_05860 [Weissella cibaria]TVV27688.1 hypothetical protein FO435_07235 [Weissella cibaria]TVV35891.1 hypothetical protein FO439_04505 [Weissella cibaria]TVV40880.1 hypothetical protein FO438_07065 [Weissella cibaria]